MNKLINKCWVIMQYLHLYTWNSRYILKNTAKSNWCSLQVISLWGSFKRKGNLAPYFNNCSCSLYRNKKFWKKKANKMKFHYTLRDSFQTYNLNTPSVYFYFSLEVEVYKDYSQINSSLLQPANQLFLHPFQWTSALCRHHCEHRKDTDGMFRTCLYKIFSEMRLISPKC